MTTLLVSEDLVQTIEHEANLRGITVEDFLFRAVTRERTISDRKKIELEQEWWQSLPLRERAKYEGEYVAVHDRKLVDHDTDRLALYRRVRNSYGSIAVLIMPAEGPQDIVIRTWPQRPEQAAISLGYPQSVDRHGGVT